MGRRGLRLLEMSGLAFSVVYPALVVCIGRIWGQKRQGSASGRILSIASLLDIGFNVAFGRIVQIIGYRRAFLLIPLSMGGCLVLSLFLARRTDLRENSLSE